jgi:hypothetical protein
MNPATVRAEKELIEESYGKKDGFETRLAARLETDKLTKRRQALNPEDRGGRRRKSKRYTRRR